MTSDRYVNQMDKTALKLSKILIYGKCNVRVFENGHKDLWDCWRASGKLRKSYYHNS